MVAKARFGPPKANALANARAKTNLFIDILPSLRKRAQTADK
jgi:hypothetical protein